MRFLPVIFITLALLSIPLPLHSDSIWQDKIQHFATSAFLTTWSYGICHYPASCDRPGAICISITLVSGVGIGKEFYDINEEDGKFDWVDLLFDAGGIICGLIIIYSF